MELTDSQYKSLSQITGNITAAWFILGVVSPVLIGAKNIKENVWIILTSLVAIALFIAITLSFSRRVK